MRRKIKTKTTLIALVCALTTIKTKAQTIPNYYNHRYPYPYYKQHHLTPTYYQQRPKEKNKLLSMFIEAGYRFSEGQTFSATLEFTKFYLQVTAMPQIQKEDLNLKPQIAFKKAMFEIKNIKFLAGINIQDNPKFINQLFAPSLELYYKNLSVALIGAEKAALQIQFVLPIFIKN
jgi:hypothetical protein